jgi:hypothetical protein
MPAHHHAHRLLRRSVAPWLPCAHCRRSCHTSGPPTSSQGLTRDLGFSASDRAESVRRASEVAQLFSEAGVVTVVSLISPYRKDRDIARAAHEKRGIPFLEVRLRTASSSRLEAGAAVYDLLEAGAAAAAAGCVSCCWLRRLLCLRWLLLRFRFLLRRVSCC